jgi:hypothetical protein
MIRFDAYTATTKAAKFHDLVGLLIGAAGDEYSTNQGHGFHTFGHRIAVKDSSGSEVGAVQWGGRQGELSMIEVKGEKTPQVAQALREQYWHRVTRVDACADFDAVGAFDRLLGPCLDVKKEFRLKGSKLGDWEDFPEDGRTLYLGAPSSVTRVRLYEKGKQKEYVHLERENWVRIEVQVRPLKDAKASFATVSPADVWGASAWSRELAGRVLHEHIDPHPAGTVYRLSERDTALRWMCKQYGAHLLGLAAELGSWDCVGLQLKHILSEQKKGR